MTAAMDPDTVRLMSDPIDPTRLPRPVVAGLTAEREATIARLQDAAAASEDDAFDLDMLDERLELAMKARTLDELRVLTRDLPAVVPMRAATPAVLAEVDVPAPQVSAFFSSVVRKGRRAQPRAMRARAVFGSVVIDLREATFAPGVTTLECRSVFGSFEESGNNDLAAASPDAPLLHVVGRAVFASVEVLCRPERKAGKSRLEARRAPDAR